jgi:hypothetical protein
MLATKETLSALLCQLLKQVTTVPFYCVFGLHTQYRS